ncbi:MAG: hypothetical protein HYZ83_06545, partial [Candidatus Omnitrophica bacterium]|nr:hypothetical protein [Candidatus Omnitrophota bacterium]
GKLEFESRIESLRQNLNRFQGRLPKLEEELMDSAIQKESFESLRSGIKERLISYQRELELINIENQDTGQQRQNAVLEREKLEKELARAEECEKSIRQNQEMLIHDIEKMDHQNDAFLQQLAEHKMRIESMKERGILLQDTIGLLAGHQERSQNRLEVLTLEMQKNQETQQGLASSDEQIAGEQTQLEDSLRRAEVALELIRQEKAGVENRMNEIQGLIQDSSRKKQTLTESTHGLEMSTLDLGYKEKNIYERLEQTYRIDLRQMPAENYALRENETVDTINEQVSGLREKVEGLGTVNLLAIEEYDELKQRYDFLSTQQKDLQDSRESLLEAIRKINRTTKSLFEETFVKVQETFKEYYQILFRGGEARLVLVDETNPLESGIDIVVRPPGKKLQHITLLSGGEKALTAIALLFSLFKIKPSPYCVLDEVDAPLDEANIDRFLSVLRTFLDMSQFIIVTHNRKTIAMGDSLFGVTMQEAGVSRLVSVKMNPNAPLPEYLQNKTGEKQTSVSDTIIV